MRDGETGDRAVLTVSRLLLVLPFLAYALVVNGAVPGIYTPTLGQAVWLTGFAQSIADAPTFSVFAHTLGIPEPAAIALGLPMALVAALALKAGISPPDAYAAACLFWFVVAFWGAYALARRFGASTPVAAAGAAVWLSFPIVWPHAGYSALSIAIALLPAYYYSAVRIIEAKRFAPLDFAVFLLLVIVSSFMDGYSFIMFASACLATLAKRCLLDREFAATARAAAILLIGFAVSFYLYNSYSPSAEFKYDIDFFRGWGLDLSFLLSPPHNVFWLPDLLGISTMRDPARFFGDASVHLTTFAIVPIALAVLTMLLPYGDRRYKLCFFLIGVIALYLSLGPSFKFDAFRPEGLSELMPPEYALGPTGTAFLWENVPGLYSMRAVYRWMALAFLGFWAVIMVAMSDRRMPTALLLGVLATLAAFNFPNLGRLNHNYSAHRSAFLQMEADLKRVLQPHFNPGETVAFLPAGNDFLVNFAALLLGVRTYNIGGDKNFAVARAAWPPEMHAASQARTPEAFADGVFGVLSGNTDMVAIPYINLLWAAHDWPHPRDRFEEMQPNLAALRARGMFDIVETEYFALVRMNPAMAAMTDEERQNAVAAMACPAEIGARRVELEQGVAASFTDPATLCGSGWSGVEVWGRWNDGGSAALHFDLPEPAAGRAIEFDARSYLSGEPARQSVRVTVNGEARPDWVFVPGAVRQIVRLDIPDGADRLDIQFAFPDARSPRDVAGGTGDPRVIGVGLGAVCLTQASSPPCLTLP